MFLALIRHGSAEPTHGRCIGHTDVALSPAGEEAIRRLASAWHAERATTMLPSPARIVASDLTRAWASAQVMAAVWGTGLDAEPRLREMHFGEWENRGWTELEASDGDRLAAWMRAWVTTASPGGESFQDLIDRVASWCAEFRRAGQDSMSGGTSVTVAHAGSIRALLCHLLGWPPARAFDIRVDPARITGLRLDATRSELLFLNADRVPAHAGSAL